MEKIELTFEIITETSLAYLLNDGTIEKWVPKSQVEIIKEDRKNGVVVFDVPEWLAQEKGFI